MNSNESSQSSKDFLEWKDLGICQIPRSRKIITPRDLRILMHLLRFRISSIAQIHVSVWGQEKSVCNMYRRLKRLSQLGLIIKRPVVAGHEVIAAYELTHKGVCLAAKNKGVSRKGQFISQAPMHDLNLSELSRALEKLRHCKRLWTETEIRTERQGAESGRLRAVHSLGSDALILIDGVPTDIACAVEYERTRKSADRISDRFFKYEKEPSVGWVLYVCESKSDMEALMSIDRKFFEKEESKSYFCLRKDLLNPKDGRVAFLRPDNSEIFLS